MTSPISDPQVVAVPPSATPAPPSPPPSPNVDGTARSILGEDQSRTPTLELRQGVITAVNLATARCSVILGGGDVTIPNVAYLSNYKPTVGDTCWVLVNGPDLLALDRDGKFGAAAYAGLQAAEIATSQTRSSTSFGDLSTVGPQVVTTVPASGRVLIQVSSYVQVPPGVYQSGGLMGFALSGANSLSAADQTAVGGWISHGDTTQEIVLELEASKVALLTGLTPGTTTITAKYRSYRSDVAMAWKWRTLWVLPL